MKNKVENKERANCANCNDDLRNSFMPKELFGLIYCDICQKYRRPWRY